MISPAPPPLPIFHAKLKKVTVSGNGSERPVILNQHTPQIKFRNTLTFSNVYELMQLCKLSVAVRSVVRSNSHCFLRFQSLVY